VKTVMTLTKEDYVHLISTNISIVINVLDTIKPENVLQLDIFRFSVSFTQNEICIGE
jgi:hypothetical protein